jgi:hypothetical protein
VKIVTVPQKTVFLLMFILKNFFSVNVSLVESPLPLRDYVPQKIKCWLQYKNF